MTLLTFLRGKGKSQLKILTTEKGYLPAMHCRAYTAMRLLCKTQTAKANERRLLPIWLEMSRLIGRHFICRD